MDLSPAHLHLVLNHIPVLGTMLFAPLVLVWGLLRRSRDVTQIGLLLAVLLAITTIPIYLTGERQAASGEYEKAAQSLEATLTGVDPEGVALVPATSFTSGFSCLRKAPVPIRVPVVPRHAKKCVILPPVCAQISGPVDRKCASGLAGLPY